jgi:myo-inositol-1(or 4)-monophosphatase
MHQSDAASDPTPTHADHHDATVGLRDHADLAEVAARLHVARAFAEQADRIALEHFQRPTLEATLKPDGSYVTPADKRIEERFRQRIAAEFPSDGVLGEEFDETPASGPCRWIIDPIDGTHSYVRGLTTWAILIGIQWNGVHAAGLASFPATSEAVFGGPGLSVANDTDAAWRRTDGAETAARVSTIDNLDDAIVELTRPQTWISNDLRRPHDRLIDAIATTRGWDDAYSFALVATGRAEAAVSLRMSLWDVAAFVPIVTAAGGRMTAWNTNAPTDGSRTIASNALVHDHVADILNAADNAAP